jgi:hypothetical protein
MRKEKKKRLESKGWKIGSAKEFLALSEEESAYIELKTRLAEGVRQRRQQTGVNSRGTCGEATIEPVACCED